ncbi:hypothetical protein BJX64DRAFT_127981 [Aspergillus heterothallicus]
MESSLEAAPRPTPSPSYHCPYLQPVPMPGQRPNQSILSDLKRLSGQAVRFQYCCSDAQLASSAVNRLIHDDLWGNFHYLRRSVNGNCNLKLSRASSAFLSASTPLMFTLSTILLSRCFPGLPVVAPLLSNHPLYTLAMNRPREVSGSSRHSAIGAFISCWIRRLGRESDDTMLPTEWMQSERQLV